MPDFKFPDFPDNNKSLLRKYLTEDIFNQLAGLKTSNNFTLEKAIKSGVENPDSGVGIYAGDAESYTLFAPIFDPIIEDYHKFTASDSHNSDMKPPEAAWSNPDKEGKYILSTRIRVGRNLADMPLGPAISTAQRNEVENRASIALMNLPDELKGRYYRLSNLSDEERQKLVEDHFLFKSGDRFLESAGLNRDWPEGRGIFHNTDKTFLVWVNEEDQLRIISMQMGGDIFEVFSRLCKAVDSLSKSMSFLQSKHLGYITSCPTNLGTAMRASVHIKLPKLADRQDLFKKITDEHYLQIRGIHGEHTESAEPIFDISNKRRLGVTEVELIRGLYDGILALINKEKSF
ncbi:MAG: arginine kinase [Denitrovibrio sp.]|nr:MAG: arginine kinase [Denitrovibrio sp.]